MTRLLNSQPLAAGRVAEVFPWRDGRVVKLWRRGGRQEAEREARIAQAAFENGVATPRVFDVIEVEGRAGMVCERADGPTMVTMLTTRPWTVVRCATQFAQLQGQMHSCPAPPDLPSARDALTSGIRHANALSEAQRTRAIEILHALPQGNRLCHGDLHPDNILMTQRGPLIVDWANAVSGPPVADVARSAYLLRHSALPAFMPAFQRVVITLFRALFYSLYIRRYASHQPLDYRELAHWAVPIAAARLSEGIPEETQTCIEIVGKGL